MKNPLTRRGKVEQTNEMAEMFNRSIKYNKAFTHESDDTEDHSESDALYHHYSDHKE